MRRHLRLIAVLPGLLGLLLVSGVALADPVNNPNAFLFEDMPCDTGQIITFVTTNAAASGQIVSVDRQSADGVLIFRSADLTITNLNTGEVENVTFSQHGQKTGLTDDLLTCQGSIIFDQDEETFRTDAVFTFTLVPRDREG